MWEFVWLDSLLEPASNGRWWMGNELHFSHKPVTVTAASVKCVFYCKLNLFLVLPMGQKDFVYLDLITSLANSLT